MSDDNNGSKNELTISCVDITNITYVSGTLDVTQNEEHNDSPSISQNSDGSWKITQYADRKKSSQIALVFNDWTDNEPMYAKTNQGGDSLPGEMNFCFQVEITFSEGDSPVLCGLGQGSSAGGNNWWINSYNIVNNGNATMVVINNGQIIAGYNIDGNNSSFDLTKVS